jgi:hypothetical protein
MGSIEGAITEGEEPVGDVNVKDYWIPSSQPPAIRKVIILFPHVYPGTYSIEFEKLSYYTQPDSE